MPERKKVLFCDDPGDLRFLQGMMAETGMGVEFVPLCGDRYHPSPEELERIESETVGGDYDHVVIGNNMGAGVQRATAVAEGMRDSTSIVWNVYAPGAEQPYRGLGIRHFLSRDDLPGHLRNVLK